LWATIGRWVWQGGGVTGGGGSPPRQTRGMGRRGLHAPPSKERSHVSLVLAYNRPPWHRRLTGLESICARRSGVAADVTCLPGRDRRLIAFATLLCFVAVTYGCGAQARHGRCAENQLATNVCVSCGGCRTTGCRWRTTVAPTWWTSWRSPCRLGAQARLHHRRRMARCRHAHLQHLALVDPHRQGAAVRQTTSHTTKQGFSPMLIS
jgi:hypothetical protein